MSFGAFQQAQAGEEPTGKGTDWFWSRLIMNQSRLSFQCQRSGPVMGWSLRDKPDPVSPLSGYKLCEGIDDVDGDWVSRMYNT